VFAEPDRTGYDLRFRLFGFPVRVHPFFWLAMLIFGADLFNPDRPEFLLSWIAIGFVSFLVHELGHAAADVLPRHGQPAEGVQDDVRPDPERPERGRWQRVAVALAGPGAGFVLATAVWASNQATPWAGSALIAAFAYRTLLWINIVWGLVNLLPVIPLDGGRVSQEVCVHVLRTRGMRVALQLSMVTAGAVAVYSLACMARIPQLMELLEQAPWWFPFGGLWTLILFGVLAYQSYQMLQQLGWADSHWDQ
jgi:hypothetical protein